MLIRHQLEDEIPTVASPLLEEVESWLDGRDPSSATFDADALRALVVTRSEALRRGLVKPDVPPVRERRAGFVGALTVPDPVSPTALELYLRCPFKYLSRYLLGLEEEEDVDEMLTPLERGRILHDLLQEGFEAWDAGSERPRPLTPESYERALQTFRDIAVKKIPPEHRRVELPRLFGSAGEAERSSGCFGGSSGGVRSRAGSSSTRFRARYVSRSVRAVRNRGSFKSKAVSIAPTSTPTAPSTFSTTRAVALPTPR